MVRLLGMLAAFVLVAPLFAQSPPKKILTAKDYDNWNSMTGMTLSPDGKWIAYNLFPNEGDGHFVIKNVVSGTERRIPRAGRPATPATAESGTNPPGTPPTTPPATPPAPGGGRFGGAFGAGGTTGGSIYFSPDSTKLFVQLPPAKAAIDQAKTDKKDAPRAALCVIELESGKIVERIERVRTYALHGEKPGYLVMHKEPRPEPKAEEKPKPAEKEKEKLPEPKAGKKGESEDEGDQPPAGRGQGGGRFQRPNQPGAATTGPTPPGGVPRRAVGSDLVIRNLADGNETTYADVVEFSIAKDLKQVVYTTSVKKDDGNTVLVAAIGKTDPPATIKAGKARYYRLAWDDKQTKLAFFAEEVVAEKAPAPSPTATKPPAIFLWERTGGEAKAIVSGDTPGLAKSVRLTDRTLSFTTDGTKLSLTVVPVSPEPEKPATPTPTVAAADKVDLDLWHWKDELIQPMQRIRANQERNKSYSAAYFLDTKQLRQISSEEVTAALPSHGDWTVGTDDRKYRYLTGYGASLRDTAFVNVRTGETKPVWNAFFGRVSMSPTNKFAITFDGKDWWSLAVPNGSKVNLTAKLPVKFFNEDHDTPDEAPAYGQPQWTSDEKFLLLPDRYDIWKVAVDGSSAENVTKIGRELKTRFRLLRIGDTEPETPMGPPSAEPTPPAAATAEPPLGFDLSKPWLLAAENLHTRDTGFYRLEPGQKPKLLVMAARKFGNPVQAKSGDTLLLTASTFSDYGDYYTTDKEFKEIKRVTDIQPAVRDFNWGKAELVHYTSLDGKPLSGILVKPENFDSTKKYPMIVYIYERLSQNLHSFTTLPMVTRGQVINPAVYASNGYLVLMPDIAYSTGYPGPSSLKCVLPAIQAVVDRGCVDEAAIGINGQSWGGYQIAYMITQTNRFKAAVAGAAVTNMTSAYGGIRWGTGLPREFQYERTQSRIGATLWQAPMRYIENSPVFMADRVQTPLLMINNDKDDAVPWYQGIEFYLALRRLGKEVYMLNYIDEVHNLRKKANARDFSIRMQQFFDHHLKGAPMPEWMAKGVPFSEREKEKERLGK
jgi:dienelactone hydrolase